MGAPSGTENCTLKTEDSTGRKGIGGPKTPFPSLLSTLNSPLVHALRTTFNQTFSVSTAVNGTFVVL